MAATDNFSNHSTGLIGSFRHNFSITPHDVNELSNVTRGIYVGSGGDIKLTTIGGDTVTYSNAQSGSTIPVQAKIVFSTGTTATLLLGGY